MGKVTLGRLNEILFEELERINQVDASDRDAVKDEIARSKAIQGIAKEVNESARTMLDTARFRAEWAGARQAQTPPMLEDR